MAIVVEDLVQRTAADVAALAVLFGIVWRVAVRPAIRRARRELLELIAATVAEELSGWGRWRRLVDDRLAVLEHEHGFDVQRPVTTRPLEHLEPVPKGTRS